MKNLGIGFASLIVGFLLLGPLGAILGVVMWIVLTKKK